MQLSKEVNAKKIKLTAGIHRQTWISGYLVFVDVRIDNQSRKVIKNVEMQLEKTTLFYSYSAPSTTRGSAAALRLPDQRLSEIIVRKGISDGFQGVGALSQDVRTCRMELPPGLVSIVTGV